MLSGIRVTPHDVAVCLKRQLVTLTFIMALGVIGFNVWLNNKGRHMLSLSIATPVDLKRYAPPPSVQGVEEPGEQLSVGADTMRKLGIPYQTFVSPDRQTMRDFVFATAASSNHFKESMDAVASVQAHFPEKTIFYYDLGLTEKEVKQIKEWCHVTYRKFRFAKYPDHVRELKNYAWKPLIVQDVLRYAGGVFWMDSSVRLTSANLTVVLAQLVHNGGLAVMKEVAHSNYVVTHPGMYDFLPSDQQRQRVTSHGAATTFMAYRTRAVYWGILHWWFLCALDLQCIAPVSKTACLNKREVLHGDQYSGCHRFDQAALNLLASNHFEYQTDLYMIGRKTGFLVIQKYVTNDFNIQTCEKL